MLDLDAVARTFLRPAIWLSKREHVVDAPVIKAVHDQNQPKREDVLKNWLRSYSVLQGLCDDQRDAVVRAILRFADKRECDLDLSLSYNGVMTNFRELYYDCKNVVQRDVTSLTSKALWCCYPSAIPLYDQYAQQSIWMISRLAGIELKNEHKPGDRYGPYAEIWFAIYRALSPLIDASDLEGYPYRVRVFDKILWMIGEANYNRDPRKVGLAAGAAKG